MLKPKGSFFKASLSGTARLKMGACVLSICGVWASSAWAADHALIMGVGQYQNPEANLPGIGIDVEIARDIARSMGIPSANIKVLRDQQASVQGMASAFNAMAQNISQGDRVFVYFSGHGTQETNPQGGAQCTEGPVGFDMGMYPDRDLQASLQQISAKASQVVMFNDSCFSGGAATKSMSSTQAKPKFFSKNTTASGAYLCGDAINAKSFRNLVDVTSRQGNNMVYVAASADNEVAFATPNGSSATLAWQTCIRSGGTDANMSGALSAQELVQCAQREVSRMGFNQTITVVGNRQLPLIFAATHASSPAPDNNAAAAAVANRGLLDEVRAAASSSVQVGLTLSRQDLVIAQPGNQNPDVIEYTVRTNTPGYLYILHVGSDGKTFDMLFPNARESNNRVPSGTARRGAFASTGPAGTSYLMAVVSETPRKFEGAMPMKGNFMAIPSTHASRKNLMEVTLGVGQQQSARFGASELVSVQERN